MRYRTVLKITLALLFLAAAAASGQGLASPGAPQDLAAEATSSGIELGWNAPSGTIDTYKIYRASGGGSAVLIATVDGSVTTYTDNTVSIGVSYTYHVTATSDSGTGPNSDTVTKTSESYDVAANLRSLIAALQKSLTALQADVGDVLPDCIQADNDDGIDDVYFVGCNVHIQNGKDDTETTNGVGNLIIGYNEEPTYPQDGERDGSHNLVIGDQNRYTAAAGLVVGYRSEIRGDYAAAIGGERIGAYGAGAVAIGGNLNQAEADRSTAIAGYGNEAKGEDSAAIGGYFNEVTAEGRRGALVAGSNLTLRTDTGFLSP